LVELDPFPAKQGGFDLWNEHLGLGWKMRRDVIEVLATIPLEQILNRALAGIVGGERKPPVMKLRVQSLEIFRRCLRARLGFEPLVERPNTEAIPFGRRRHQLKKSSGALRTSGARVE